MSTKEKSPSLLFLGKAEDPDCSRALEFCIQTFSSVAHCLGKWGDPLPSDIRAWEGDYIISYLSRWVIPPDLLGRARRAAINFHPASPEYPGIGCTNFALYENAEEYGVTCHHMATQVDSGRIIAVRRFPILASDNVATLLRRTYEHQMALFFDIAPLMAEGQELPISQEKWSRRPFTRREFNELFRIMPDMPPDEIARRIRATSYGKYQPYVEIQGYRFGYVPSED